MNCFYYFKETHLLIQSNLNELICALHNVKSRLSFWGLVTSIAVTFCSVSSVCHCVILKVNYIIIPNIMFHRSGCGTEPSGLSFSRVVAERKKRNN